MQDAFIRSLSAATASLVVDRDLSAANGIAPDLNQSVAYAWLDEDHKAQMTQPLTGISYTRRSNPTSARLAKVIAHLEGKESGLMFASGVGAIATSLMAFTKSGDHIIGQTHQYIETTTMMDNVLAKYGVESTRVDQTDPSAFERAIKPNTTLIVLETPSNPMMRLTDLRAVTAIARAHGIPTVCDNTFATPINQRPHEFGVDIVLHSVSKYIGGHHDLLAGCVTGSRAHVEKIWSLSYGTGATGAPFNSWLALRGIRTLELRMRQHNQNGLALARFLEGHRGVSRVHYPGLESHPEHQLAAQQMTGFGGVVTFDLKGGHEAGRRFISRMRLPTYSGGIGGHTSTVLQPTAMVGARLDEENLRKQGITPGLLRFCVGIENTEDLLADVEHSLG